MEDKKINQNKNENNQEETIIEKVEVIYPQYKKDQITGHNQNIRKNFQFLQKNVVLFISGLAYKIYNLETQEIQIIESQDGGGIGAIDIHPSFKYFAIGEKGIHPNIYIYQYPTLKLCKTLKKGTEKNYSCISFSKNGTKLASVGSYPDYSLTIWDWEREQTILKVKAFSQDVYNVGFSQFNDNILCTVGMAHIKFWKIANTFTGLKLKGEIGKFGQVELSDIRSFIIMQDRKVVSGCESGYILLWEGNFIKAVIRQKDLQPCHKGNIECLKIINNQLLISSGEDNYIKIWNLEEIDQLQGDEQLFAEINPIREIKIAEDNELVNIMDIQTQFINNNILILYNQKGGIYNIIFQNQNFQNTQYKIIKSYEFQTGDIVGIYKDDNKFITGYSSGQIVSIDQNNFMKNEIKKIENLQLTIIKKNEEFIFTGDMQGVMRIYNKQYVIQQRFKVFDKKILDIEYNNNFLVVFNENEIFCFILNDQKFIPNFMYINENSMLSSHFIKDDKLIIGLVNGFAKQLIIKQIDQELTQKNFIVDTQILNEKKGILRMTEDQKPKQDEDDIMFVLNDKIEIEDVEWDPQPIRSILSYIPETDFDEQNDQDQLVLVSSEGEFSGNLYVLNLQNNFNEEQGLIRPIKQIQIRNHIVSKMMYLESAGQLLLGYEDGILEIRNCFNLKEIYTRTQGHDQQYGKITNMIYQPTDKLLLTIAQDNSITQYNLEIKDKKLENQTTHQINIGGQIDYKEDSSAQSKYSLQQQKIQAVKDQKLQEAEIYKQELKQNLYQLEQQYQKLKQKNDNLADHFKLNQNEIQFDKEFTKYLQEKKEQNIQEVLKEIEYDKILSQMKVEKLKKFYLNNLQNESFAVQKITKKQFVYSIKLQKLSQFMEQELDKIYKIIEKENQNESQQQIQDQHSSVQSQSQDQQSTLIEILNEIKSQYNENKNQNYFKKTKGQIKEECRIFQTIDKMREFKDKITNEIRELRKEEPKIQSVENCTEIIKARDNFGDYVLKSSNNYRVSEENRINVQNIKTQIFLMEKFYYNSCQTFNDALYQLKQRKKKLIEEINQSNKIIRQINSKLGIEEEVFCYNYDESMEDPLKVLEVGQEEVEAYIKDLEKQQIKKKQGIFGGMEQEEVQQIKSQDQNVQQNTIVKTNKNIFQNQKRKNRLQNVNNSKMSRIQQIQRIQMMSEKKKIYDKIQNKIKIFEEDIDWTIEERVKLKFELKMAKIKILELYQELLEVEIYEEEDNILLNQLIEQREILKSWNEKKTINASRLKESKRQDQQTRSELELAQEIYREKVFPSEIEKAEFVYNYYKLHYKSNIEKENNNDINGEDFINQNIDNEKKEWILIVEQNDDWLELLKKRRQCEDNVKAIRDERILLDNECAKIEENLVIIQKNLTRIKFDIDNLQLIKQKKLNQLLHSFILSFDQIYIGLPLNTIQDQTLFTENQFYQLKNRIQELRKECKDIENEKNQLMVSQESLAKELILLRQVHKKSSDELKENFHLKFGEVIDLKILDSLKQTKKLKELKQQLKDKEISSTKKIEEANTSLQKTKKELYLLKKKNTEIIKRITILGQTQLKLNKTLDSTNKHIFKNEDNQNSESIQNYKKDLVSIIKLLNQELDDLKTEIVQLRSKGTTY